MAYLYADFATRHRRRFQLLVHAALPAAPDEVPAYVKQNVQQLHRLLADQLQRLNPDLTVPQREAVALFAAMHGVCILNLPDQLLTDPTMELRAAMGTVVDNAIYRVSQSVPGSDVTSAGA